MIYFHFWPATLPTTFPIRLTVSSSKPAQQRLNYTETARAVHSSQLLEELSREKDLLFILVAIK